MTLRIRFYRFIRVHPFLHWNGTPCWEWTGCRHRKGYGQIRGDEAERGRVLKAHRVSWTLHVGPIPAGLVVDHLCERKWCVSPFHLEPVTQSVNTLRAVPLRRRNQRR